MTWPRSSRWDIILTVFRTDRAFVVLFVWGHPLPVCNIELLPCHGSELHLLT